MALKCKKCGFKNSEDKFKNFYVINKTILCETCFREQKPKK